MAVSGRPRLLALVIVLVSSCAFLSALVHFSPLVVSLRRCGCRPVSRPAQLLACSLRGAGRGWALGVSALPAWRRGRCRCEASRACPGCPCDCLSPCRSMRRVSDEMRRMAAAERYQVSALLACRVISPRSSTRGTGREAERMMRSGSGMLVRWSVRAICLVLSRAGCSDEMMRNDGEKEVSCFRCPMISVFLSFLFPSPSRRSACLSRADHDELRGLCVALGSRLIARAGGWYSVSRALRVSIYLLFLGTAVV